MIMKKTIVILAMIAALPLMQSCDKDFSLLEQNQNLPAQVPPGLVLNGILNDLYQQPWSLAHRQNQFWCCNYNYYGTNEYWSNATLSFATLKNVGKMEEEAVRAGGGPVNPYAALGKFFRAFFYVQMSQRVGDLPLTEANKGLENILPSYDSQEDVYVQVIKWLDEANDDLASLIAANDATLAGDFMHGNNLLKWQKTVNAFKLRVLISLNKKQGQTLSNGASGFVVEAKFAEVLADPVKYPLMSGLGDDLKYVYNGTTNLYPTNPGNRGFDKNRYNLAATHIGLLTSLQDPRVFVVANPAEKKITDGVAPDNFAAYVGANSGEALDDMTTKAQAGEYSFANQKRYYSTFTGPEPAVQIGYAEQCFNIAEAIHRGWAPGSAATYYTAGITASMEFFGIQDGTVIPIYETDNDLQIGSFTANLTAYLAQPSVAYAGAGATGLTQILQQKYLAFFQNSGQEAYFNYRRTGVPNFLFGPGTGNSGVIPKRWLYPVAESVNNPSNYMDAVMNQFGTTTESLNDDLWIEKN
jgi:hypothetical protein